ncbi:ATP-dependent RNA helicase DHX29-like isoform X1 [Sinocyclocheilus rhinocerous]|uniref:ATP-dependent RNA helicase DHX29-like isoform X1 n=1 Tax=Sinocyclocheilus rhinocerous TaxID=307959 RepID=UPI0007B98039|nr:PREDICTED: ATP-dependent RNA helicase DHX29-like isoform X1 [Sinocyclocheilus rhinocerous]XP_016374316.1 PREDICTED: ATP-dependent RNA helicase DHX29-like isoform X1 [Sinocyclocheilus rhinocerous]
MGGKKKKSAAVLTVNATNAASESTGKHQPHRPNNEKSSSKENKPRAPKTYSLNTNAQTDTSSVSDKSVLKVVIQPELEKKVIKLINDYRQEHADKGPISGRLTFKKLLDLYTALQMFQFKTEHIEEAMKSSMLYGGDLTSALDWLCLNLRDDELPEGFSQKMQEEKQKTRPKFQAPKEDEKQTVAKKEASKEDEKPKAKTSVKDNGGSMKEWILRYAEQSEDQSSEEDENKDASVFNPELEEKFDPNDRYLLLTAQLYDAKEMAAEFKAKKDKAGQRTAQDRIRVIQQEMKSLESHPMFNSLTIKVKVTPKEEKKPVTLTDGKEELNFSLFEQAETPPAETTEKKNKEPKDIRNFDYTSRSWTGKSPKQFLIDWCRKNLPKSPPPSFEKVAVERYWKCRVRIQRPNDVLEVCPTILTEDGMQAQHLGATLALYNLVKAQSVHQLLPSTYREVWLEWQDSEQKEEEQTRSAINKPRDQFIAHLLTHLKQHQTLQPQAEQQERLQDAELEDSWENLDIQEDHEPQCGGSFVAEETSRRLFLKLRSSALARRLLVEREQLPVFQHRQQVLEALRCHRVLVIAGETGSGKSTQIPQFILEELLANGEAAQPCNVVVTQPRRISATSLASRVSQELGSEDGPGGKSSLCGYQIRMENRSGDATRLLYCTTGVLLRKLQQDRLLSSLTHIIVDEVHERSVQSDFLLTILKEVVHKRSDLHLILMSATVDCQKFANYFNRCPVVTIPGRTFPVEVFHLEDIVEETGYVLEQDSEYSQKFVEEEEEVSINITQKGGKTLLHQELIVRDSDPGWDLSPELDHFSNRTRHVLQYMNPNKINMDLILDLLEYLDKSPQFRDVDGAVLIFLPGLAHIQQLYDLLTTDKRFSSKDRYKLVALHSTLSSQDQSSAFTVPPPGVRKIVLSTNIAETGVTIPDVVFVIDTGKTKENRYHESSQVSSLVETFVSKASALQRQGRAGRVREGFCFRLYPKFRFKSFIDYSIPEILRVPLEELCLHIMKCEYGSPEDFLCRALDAPQQQAVCNAVSLLRKIGACQQDSYTLTPLGHHLATLPVNVKIGKMLIFGAIFGCLEPIATIAAAMSEKSPFVTPMSRKEEANLAKSALAVANSDHMTIYSAYLGWKSSRSEGPCAEVAYCRRHFLSRTALMTIEDVKQELIRMVEQAGFIASKPSRTPRSWPKALGSLSQQDVSVLKAVLTAGLYDSVGRILCTPSLDVQERVACVAETAQGKAHVHPSSVNRFLQTHGWLLFQEKVKYTKVFLRDTTLISPLSMLLFGGDIDVQHRERLVSLDGWIYFQAPVRIGVIFKHLRKLIDSLLERKLANPKINLEDEKTIQIITELIKSENML